MKDLDRKDFITAMVKELTDQIDNGDYSIISKIQVPTGATILPAVWKMKRKQDIKTRDIKKWNMRLYIDGYRMKKGIH